MALDLQSLTPEQISEINELASKVADQIVGKYTKILDDLKSSLAEFKKLRQDAWDKIRTLEYGEDKSKLQQTVWDQYNPKISQLESQIPKYENIMQALSSGGRVTGLTDATGYKYEDIPDFRLISTEDIMFDEETILVDKRPPYIPLFDHSQLEAKGFVMDSLRLDKDSYLVCTDSYQRDRTDKYTKKQIRSKANNQFAVLTLDQLVLTVDYYQKYVKAEYVKKAEEANKRAEEHWINKVSDYNKERFLNQPDQRHVYKQLPAKKKKEVTYEKWITLTWQEKDAIHHFYKKTGTKRLKKGWLDSKHMPASYHYMYEDFINPIAIVLNTSDAESIAHYRKHNIRTKEEIDRIASKRGQLIAHPDVWNYWAIFRDMMEFKIKDIQIQREDIAETYSKALETSFGDSNTITDYKDEYGILLKRQDGSKIQTEHIDQILRAWRSVNAVFGSLVPNALKYNLKISHSAKKLIFASKAIGVFVPSYGTIGVSDKYGDNQFQSTMSHECAHFIDYLVGRLDGHRWATDDYESTAGQIAFEFRNHMNKPKQHQSDYINATKECFARALQQYFTIESQGEDAELYHSYKDLKGGEMFYAADHFVNKENFENIIKPLILKFFKEQKDVLQTTVDLDASDAPVPIGETEEEIEIPDTPTETPDEIYEDWISIFKEIAKDVSSVDDFITQVRTFKNIPLFVSKRWREEYAESEDQSPEEVAAIFFNKYRTKQDLKVGDYGVIIKSQRPVQIKKINSAGELWVKYTTTTPQDYKTERWISPAEFQFHISGIEMDFLRMINSLKESNESIAKGDQSEFLKWKQSEHKKALEEFIEANPEFKSRPEYLAVISSTESSTEIPETQTDKKPDVQVDTRTEHRTESNEITDAINGLRLLTVTAMGDELKELKAAIAGLELIK